MRLCLLIVVGLLSMQASQCAARVTVEEIEGRLSVRSTLPAGSHALTTRVRYGHPVEGEIVIAAGSGATRAVQALRVESWGEESFVPGVNNEELLAGVREGFGVWIRPGSAAQTYELKLDFAQFDGSELKRTQVLLRRERGAYQLSVAEGVEFGQMRRGRSLIDLMLDYPEDYRKFEIVAHACSLPEMSLVPRSRFSPSVIQQVIEGGGSGTMRDGATRGDDTVTTGPSTSERGFEPSPERWASLVSLLDSDAFSRRIQARESLLRGGPALAVYLENLDTSRLSFEQREEVAYIVEALSRVDHRAPQPLPRATVDELRREMNPRWLARLVASSDAMTRNWALGQLRQQGIDVAMPPEPTRYDRREAFRRVWSRLSGP